MNAGKPIMLPGRQIAPGEQPTLSARKRTDLTFVVGEVESVDVEKLCLTVKLRNNLGTKQNISISQPFAGTASFILGVPEIGTLILFGQQDGNFYPLTYLPNYTHGLENRNIKKWPDDIKTIDQNEFFFRVKKLLAGEVALGSSKGIELFLGDKFVLDDRFGNKFMLKSDENSIISTACNNSIFSSGVWLNSGIIKRNSASISDPIATPNIFMEPLPRGMRSYVLRPGGPDPKTDPYYTEYLLEVEDKGFSQQPENDMNGDSNRTVRNPIGIFSMGNFVGNNPSLTGSYGRILRPVLFNDVDDTVGDFLLEPVAGGDIDTHGIAISWFKPERTNPQIGAFFGVDKEGHFYQHIPSATGGGLGKGRSMSILARGSKKEIWGNDSRYSNSWDLRTTGGVVWNIGVHDEKNGNPYANRSMDVRTGSSVFYMYGKGIDPAIKDFDKSDTDVKDPKSYFKVEKIDGKERHETYGTRETIVKGSDKIFIDGARTERVLGASTVSIKGQHNLIVGDVFTENVTKEKRESFGNRKTTITSGSTELTVKSIQGDIKEEITKKGGKFVKVKLGDIQDDIAVGNRTIKIKKGGFSLSTMSGDMLMRSKQGQVTLSTKLGKVEVGASLSVDITTKPMSNVNINGGAINLKGKTRVLGGVITSKTHRDFITGAYLVGSKTVSASL
jgi:hypothetical protein